MRRLRVPHFIQMGEDMWEMRYRFIHALTVWPSESCLIKFTLAVQLPIKKNFCARFYEKLTNRLAACISSQTDLYGFRIRRSFSICKDCLKLILVILNREQPTHQNFLQSTDTEFRRNAFLNFVDGACEQTHKRLPRYAFILPASCTWRLAMIGCIWYFFYERAHMSAPGPGTAGPEISFLFSVTPLEFQKIALNQSIFLPSLSYRRHSTSTCLITHAVEKPSLNKLWSKLGTYAIP